MNAYWIFGWEECAKLVTLGEQDPRFQAACDEADSMVDSEDAMLVSFAQGFLAALVAAIGE